MTGRRRRAAAAGVVAAALAALVVVPPVRPTAAAWTDAAAAGSSLRTIPADCSTRGVFEATGRSALLAGTVQGVAIGSTPALAPVGTGAVTAATSASRALSVAAVGRTPMVSGTPLPVSLTPAGSFPQTASATDLGASAAAAGGGGAVGSVDVSGLLARAPASSVLPGLSGVSLDVGTATASASLDGCAAAWGSQAAASRSSSVSSLALRFADDAVTQALPSVRDGSAVAAQLQAQGTAASSSIAAAAGSALVAAVQRSRPDAVVATTGQTAAVTVSTTPITTVPTQPLHSGAVDLDLVSGVVTADLGGALGSGADTDVLTADRVAGTASSAAAALQQRAAALAAAETAVRDAAVVTVTGSVNVTVALLGVSTTSSLRLDASAPLAGWTDPAVTVAVTVTPTPASALADLTASVRTSIAGLLAARVRQAIADQYTSPTTTILTGASTAAASAVAAARSGLAAHLGALPTALVVTADQRPSAAASSWTGTAGTGVCSVSALRVRIRDATSDRADLFIANASVGPDRAAFR